MYGLAFTLLAGVTFHTDDASASSQVFKQRILPIFQSPKPSSCFECHLAGVDLKDYILPDAAKTFRSLRDQGLVDLDSPEKSKILHLIAMQPGDAKRTNPIHAATRKAEYDAFTAWITACAKDKALCDSPPIDVKERAKPAAPDAVIRHARGDRLLESFERNVWAWRFRCMNCHTEGSPQNDKNRQEHGERVAWMKKAGAAATMEYILTSNLIRAGEPDKSLLLRKPLGEKHGGGVKFVVGDQGYQGFRTWIEDVAAIRQGKYATTSDLPKRTDDIKGFGSDIWFKIAETPAAWGDKLLQVDLYAWDAAKSDWESSPIATTDRMVWGKGKLWQHNLTLLARADTARTKAWRAGKATLDNGRYLAKVYVDSRNRLSQNWKDKMEHADYVGQVEFQARWREGYGGMMTINGSRVQP